MYQRLEFACASFLLAAIVLLIGVAATYAMVMLSLVLLTGYGGHVSLAQFTFAGVGALAYAKLDEPNLLGLLMAALIAAGFWVGHRIAHRGRVAALAVQLGEVVRGHAEGPDILRELRLPVRLLAVRDGLVEPVEPPDPRDGAERLIVEEACLGRHLGQRSMSRSRPAGGEGRPGRGA